MKTLKQLCEDYEISDSLKERKQLREEIENRCSVYLSKLYNIAKENNYIEPLFLYSDYRSSSGQVTFDDFTDENIWVVYEDSWKYGGYCNEKFCISFKTIESFEADLYKKFIKKHHKQTLEHTVKRCQHDLKKALQELENYKND